MAQGWSVQWKSVVDMAFCAASGLPAAPVPGGGFTKNSSGSLTP